MVLNIRRRRDSHRCRRARVWLNGVDVSARCWKVDGRRRRVWLYALNEHGQKFVDRTTGRIALETPTSRRGRVHIGRQP